MQPENGLIVLPSLQSHEALLERQCAGCSTEEAYGAAAQALMPP